MLEKFVNKRYKDIFEQYIYKGQKTPFTLGTLIVCGLCFLLILVTTFTQLNFPLPVLKFVDGNFSVAMKQVSYCPQIPAMIFIIYLIGRAYSLVTFILYLLVGFFIYPIFLFGGGLEYIKTYPFGYFLGFIFAIFIVGALLKFKHTIRVRILCAILGVFAIHACAFIYCVILAIFKAINFSMIPLIINVVSGSKIGYDIVFSSIIMLVAPYIKNFFWICMKPRMDRKKIKTSRNL